MPNFFRLLLGGLIALGAIILTLLVGVFVAIGTIFGLLASRFRNGGVRPRRAHRQSSVGGAGQVIDVEVTEVKEAPAEIPKRSSSTVGIDG